MRRIRNAGLTPFRVFMIISVLTSFVFSSKSLHADSGNAVVVDVRLAAGELMKSKRINRLAVYYIPYTTSTRVSVSPDQLKDIYEVKLNIRPIYAGSAFVNGFLSAISSMHFESSADGRVDCRWGFVFYGDDNREEMAIYFDSSLRRALFNGKYFIPNNKIKPWLYNNLKGAFDLPSDFCEE